MNFNLCANMLGFFSDSHILWPVWLLNSQNLKFKALNEFLDNKMHIEILQGVVCAIPQKVWVIFKMTCMYLRIGY